MPGVPHDGVKVFRYSESRKVTFTGRAPVNSNWPCDTCERVYGGYVVLDKDPNDVNVEMSVINGCLRLFFPGARGTLHFFPSNKQQQDNSGAMIYWPCENSSEEKSDHKPNVILGHVAGTLYGIVGKTGLDVTSPERFSYTYPFLMSGVQGLCESKLVDEGKGKRVYVRIDMPGTEQRDSLSDVDSKIFVVYYGSSRVRSFMVCGGDGTMQHRFDQGPRDYFCTVVLQCDCCTIVDAKHKVKDGVFRVSFQKKFSKAKTAACSSKQ